MNPILKVKEWKKQKDWIFVPWSRIEAVNNLKPMSFKFPKSINVTFTVTK